MLTKAKEKRAAEEVDFVQASVERLPFKDGVFDVTMNSCAYHFFHPETAWPEILRVTKRGGHIVDIDIISSLWNNPFVNPFLRPCIVYQRIRSKVQPLEVPQEDFFRALGLQGVQGRRVTRPFAVVQVVTGSRPLRDGLVADERRPDDHEDRPDPLLEGELVAEDHAAQE